MSRTRTTAEIISDIERNGVIKENEILLLKRRANNGDKDAANYWPEIEVTRSQSAKGFAWLWNLWKTPRGVERKNNPFGYREEKILEEWNLRADRAIFKGFFDAGNGWHSSYVPVYEYAGMEYYVLGGQINIIG